MISKICVTYTYILRRERSDQRSPKGPMRLYGIIRTPTVKGKMAESDIKSYPRVENISHLFRCNVVQFGLEVAQLTQINYKITRTIKI